jgi:hypothetical protein
MKKFAWMGCCFAAALAWPCQGQAQGPGVTPGVGGLQAVLDQVYNDMLPQSSQLIGVGQGIAGFAALWYIAVRVWRAIANAESVDVFPLLRPFVLGFLILIFPSLIALMNGVLGPTVTGTSQMLGNANGAIASLVQEKENAITANALNSLSVTPLSLLSSGYNFGLSMAYYKFKNMIREWLSEILQLFYEAAALCINTIRTFNLIVLAILGPLVLGLSVFDGFQHTLLAWIARYINVYLWLPVANIFGAIIANVQAGMLRLDIAQIQANGSTFFSSTDLAYLVFLIIGIIGYFTVPSVAGYIVNVGGGGALASKTTSVFAAGASRVRAGAGNLAGAPGNVIGGYRDAGRGGNPNSMASKMGRMWGKISV